MTRSPAWAPFLGEAGGQMLLMLVEADIRERGVAYRMLEDAIEVELPDGVQTLGLSNLAQVCDRVPRAEWPAAVATHFDLVFDSAHEDAELRSKLHDFEAIRHLLRPRLYDDTVEAHVSRLVGVGIAVALVFDLPSAMRSVSRAEAAPWGKTDEELFDIALANLTAEEAPDRQVIHGPEEVPITVVEGASYYTASHALLLSRDVVPEGHPYGALVAVPARHVFFYHLIEDNRVIYAVNALVSLAEEAHRRGPGSISDQVFWVRRGELVQIPCGVAEGTLHVTPPPLFIREVLEPLAQPSS